MDFLTGFSNNCVIQRDKKNRSEQKFEGVCDVAGTVIVTVSKNGRTVPGFKKLKIGKASSGKFSGVLKGLSVSNTPYDLKFAIVDKKGCELESAEIENILVGDLWLLGGQSNMQGYGNMENLPSKINEVRAYYMDDKWDIAKDPIHNKWAAAAPVHGGKPGTPCPHPHKGAGPGVSFGQEMFRKTNVPQGLISCAHGGTSMNQWNPDLKNLGGGSFYGAMLGRFRKLGGKVAGIVWYQGCSDTGEPEPYTDKMAKLVKALRKDTSSPDLPFVMVQLATFAGTRQADKEWTSIREQQRLLPHKIKNLLTVPAIDLELDDTIHVSSGGHNILGRRLADAMLSFFDKKVKPPIELASIKLYKEPKEGLAVIKVTFKNLYGKLVSAGRPTGFAIVKDSSEVPCIFKTVISGDNEISLHTFDTPMGLRTFKLAYGFGVNTYCNVFDSAGRPIPAFNVNIAPDAMPVTEFISDFNISQPVYISETEDNMAYTENAEFIKSAYGGFYVTHPEREKLATPQEKIFYYKCMLNCPENMKVKFLLGYDGPVKMFCDKKEMFTDLKGDNPLLKDSAEIPASLKAGNHEIFISLASNRGNAWGICLRIERLDSKEHDGLPVSI